MNAKVAALSTELNELLAVPEEPAPVEIPEPGIYANMPMSQYLMLPLLGASGLEFLRLSPKQFKHDRDKLRERLRTGSFKRANALERGTAVHMAVLEPALFEGHYHVLGTCEATKKSDKKPCTYSASVWRNGKVYCGNHDPLHGDPMPDGVDVLSEADYDAVIGMRDSILAHPRARSLFSGRGQFETTIIFDDPLTGVRCKIRPDRLVDRVGMLTDIKTTRDASPGGFPRQAENLGYFRKLAFYRRGLRAIGWPYKASATLAVESVAPFDLCPFLMEEDSLDSAEREVNRLMRIYRMCVEEDRWLGYADDLQPLQRPAWAKDADERE